MSQSALSKVILDSAFRVHSALGPRKNRAKLSFLVKASSDVHPMKAVKGSILMQYQTPLPDDTDFAKIRSRVSEIGPIFDRMPGMLFKLYGLNDPASAAIGEYSSIYLWDSLESIQNFLSGDLFDNYSAAFARPAVRWFLVHAVRGDIASVATARWAIGRLAPLPRRAHIGTALSNWGAKFQRPEALVQVAGFDPTTWESIDLTVWDKTPEIRDLDHLYELARTSVPGSCLNIQHSSVV